MTHLIQTIFFILIFHHAFCCLSLPETKPELCSNLQSNPQQMQRMSVSTGNHFRAQDLTEFCNSDSVGDRSNGLCQNIQELTPHLPTSLAGNLTEFCNPDSQLRRRPVRILTVEIQPNTAMERNGLNDHQLNVSIRGAPVSGYEYPMDLCTILWLFWINTTMNYTQTNRTFLCSTNAISKLFWPKNVPNLFLH